MPCTVGEVSCLMLPCSQCRDLSKLIKQTLWSLLVTWYQDHHLQNQPIWPESNQKPSQFHPQCRKHKCSTISIEIKEIPPQQLLEVSNNYMKVHTMAKVCESVLRSGVVILHLHLIIICWLSSASNIFSHFTSSYIVMFDQHMKRSVALKLEHNI